MSNNEEERVPVIMTEWGAVTEPARRQAVLNMRRDPKLVQQMFDKFGEAQIRRNYPEVFIAADEDADADADNA